MTAPSGHPRSSLRRLTRAVLAALPVLVVLLAGCQGRPAASETNAAADAEAFLGGPWMLTGCERAGMLAQQPKQGADDGLPEGLSTYGSVTAYVALNVAECDQLVIGNHTVVAPFRIAMVRQALEPTEFGAGLVEMFYREVFVEDAAMGNALRDAGFPAIQATIRLGSDEVPLRIEAPGLLYEVLATTPPEVGETVRSDQRAISYAFDGERLSWTRSLTTYEGYGADRVGNLVATGGYLGQVLPGSQQPVQIGDTHGSSTFDHGTGPATGSASGLHGARHAHGA